MSFRVVWRPEASAQLDALFEWIAEVAGEDVAYNYASRIEEKTSKLFHFPHRGTPRDDLVRGLRTIPYRRRTVIGYRVVGDVVELVGLTNRKKPITGRIG